jgi:hypothetical protein
MLIAADLPCSLRGQLPLRLCCYLLHIGKTYEPALGTGLAGYPAASL